MDGFFTSVPSAMLRGSVPLPSCEQISFSKFLMLLKENVDFISSYFPHSTLFV
ncbi:hypothetical protein T08_592 [Trichinella sp. T8]|nr:hypothetical protein T08_592 [Trichinella sp. T8]